MYVIGVARNGSSSGKRMLGLRVVGESGGKVGNGRVSIRFAVAYPLWVLTALRFLYHASISGSVFPFEQHAIVACCVIQTCVTIASLVMMWTRADRKTLHDLAAGTIVIRDESDGLYRRRRMKVRK
ncbi:RDD family protein [Novipirellula artificiosorum]|uniref:RDD family protein n=1 Tax=Novipirellula artificiosorum TaxID=2528016 RepID=A0A5C6D6S6_9BACT|nr:RDD family protein [Novipirellula artificiosorum]TWU31407.1 RDD family protein [Novipirellula artificiosorum]